MMIQPLQSSNPTNPTTKNPYTAQTIQDINTISTFLAHRQINSLDDCTTITTTTTTTSVPTTTTTTSSTTNITRINPKTIILAGNAILHTATTLFTYLQQQSRNNIPSSSSSIITTLLITGGIGHSTIHLRDAVLRHPVYRDLPSLLDSQQSSSSKDSSSKPGDPKNVGKWDDDIISESRILYLIFIHFFDGLNVCRRWNCDRGLKVLLEEKSGNCGANAWESRRVLLLDWMDGEGMGGGGEKEEKKKQKEKGEEEMKVSLGLGDVVIIQDPTMSLRTVMSFEMAFNSKEDEEEEGEEGRIEVKEKVKGRVKFWGWPGGFIPVVKLHSPVVGGENITEDEDRSVEEKGNEIVWDQDHENMKGVDVNGLWDMKRFYGLLLGEIVRLRDDENGYGPKGKGFIGHVDIPDEVERAWGRLVGVLEYQR